MSSEKRFITYRCNKCQRTKDYEVNNLRAFINLCSITKNCDGRLSPIATKSVRNILASSPVAGLEDWAPPSTLESSKKNTVAPAPIEYFNLSSSASYELTIAVAGTSGLPDTFNVHFISQLSTSSAFVEYLYYKTSSFNSVLGPDTSSSAKVLRFTSSDTVKVFANGVELTEVEDYVLLYSGVNGYSIQFTQTYIVSTLVKVLVFQPLPVSTSTPIVFTKNSLLTYSNNNTTWSNVKTVSINGVAHTVYTCLNTDLLPTNVLLNIYDSSQVDGLNLDDMHFLLSYAPYVSPVDRYEVATVPLNNLADVATNLRKFFNANETRIEVTGDSIVSTLTPLIALNISDITLEQVTALITSDQKPFPKSLKIIGPV